MKMVKLFKQPLSMAYRGKEKNVLLAKTKKICITWGVGKNKGL